MRYWGKFGMMAEDKGLQLFDLAIEEGFQVGFLSGVDYWDVPVGGCRLSGGLGGEESIPDSPGRRFLALRHF